MKAVSSRLSVLLAAVAVLQAGPAIAQGENAKDEEKVVVERETRVVELDEAALDAEMKEAEERLAAAARRVAELSQERLETYGNGHRFAFDGSARPRMGVNIESHDTAGPVEGIEIISITPGSAADDAGLRAGDVITAVNGESMSADSMKSASQRLLDFMRGVEEGDTLEVTYLRDEKTRSVELEPRPVPDNMRVWAPDDGSFTMPRAIEVHPAPQVVDRFRYAFGGWRSGWGDMEVVELNEGLGRYFGTDEGLLVISAPKANDFKLMDGDVIQSIDGRKPGSVDHCMRILASYQPGESLELDIMRDKRKETLRVSVPDSRTSALEPVIAPRPAAVPVDAPLPAEAPPAVPARPGSARP
jgi:C-terminal processing protease CtpA/Prc